MVITQYTFRVTTSQVTLFNFVFQVLCCSSALFATGEFHVRSTSGTSAMLGTPTGFGTPLVLLVLLDLSISLLPG